MDDRKKGGIFALLALGAAAVAAYFVTRPPSIQQTPCTYQKQADGTTRVTCRFPGKQKAPVTVDLLEAREVLSVSGSAKLTGEDVSTGQVLPLSELHVRLAAAALIPQEIVLCPASLPDTICPVTVPGGWMGRAMQLWGMSSTGAATFGIVPIKVQSAIEDVFVEVIVR